MNAIAGKEPSLFERFFKESREAMFITSRDGRFIDVNDALGVLLGYDTGELVGHEVKIILDTEEDRDEYQQTIESEGVVHQYPIALKRKDGSLLFCVIDAIVWKEDGKISGYHGLVRTKRELIESFKNYFSQLKEERRQIREERKNLVSDTMLLSRYLTDDLLEYIHKTGKNPLETKKRRVSILFFDIRNSTGIAEHLNPEVFAQFLSDVFTDIMDLVYGCHGSVNKLLGDGVMATFGAPMNTGVDAYNAVEAAVRIQEYLSTFNDVRPEYLSAPVEAGIGIATGTVFSGVIGSVRRQEYTVLGDAVNIASRLESMTKRSQEKILIDEETFHEVKDRFNCRKVFQGQIRGRAEEIRIYGVPTAARTEP